MRCEQCGYENDRGAKFCLQCGSDMPGRDGVKMNRRMRKPAEPDYGDLPMRWHEFNVNFRFWITIFLMTLGVVLFFVDMFSAESFGALMESGIAILVIDFFYVMLQFYLISRAVLARSALAESSKKAVDALAEMYISIVVVEFIHLICSAIFAESAGGAIVKSLLIIAGCIAGLVLELMYYTKRKHLFNQ